ncbi:MAG: choline-sulfatase, partial [Acidobacteriota bacterium]|nr:choline-sulfatase [Acidobacteriota bacterium]
WGPDHPGTSWAGRVARIYFGPLEVQPAELVALATPLVYPGAPRQTVTPVLNGRELPTLPMAPAWSELRIPLPPDALTSPVNVLDLRFDHEAVPARVTGGGDDRSLAAAFNLLAVLPRGEPLARARATVEGQGVGRKLVLRREPVALPLPPAERYEIRLGSVRGAGQRLAIDFAPAHGPRRRLWEGKAEDAAGQSFKVTTHPPRAARLLLTRRIEGRTGDTGDTGAMAVEMSAPEVDAQPRRERTGGPPDVFLYLIDTLRADAVGVYGSRRDTTPEIDRFSRDALVFSEARSPASWTLPATASILSGLYPSQHGVAVAGARLGEGRAPWLPDLLTRRGYETIGVSQWLLGGDTFGLDRGFSNFYVDVRQNGKTPSAAVRWFLWRHLLTRQNPERPLFGYLHVVDPHAHYRPGPRDRRFADEQPGTLPPNLYEPDLFLAQGLGKNPADVAHLRALYDGEVHAADRQFGRFLEQLKFFDLYDESLIVLVGDHGEEFAEHGGFDHGRTLYEELLRVPLIVKLPRSWKRTGRITRPVSTVDLAPTILEVVGGGGTGPAFQGASLLPAAGGREALFSETQVDGVNLKAALLGTVKCIANVADPGKQPTGLDRYFPPAPLFQAFDLARDPRERSPLSPTAQGVERCKQELDAWLAHPAERTAEHRPLAPADQAKLRSLGYIR